MGNVRIYELAKDLGITSKVLLEELQKQGIELKSHMSAIDTETADLVLEVLGENKGKKQEDKEDKQGKQEKQGTPRSKPVQIVAESQPSLAVSIAEAPKQTPQVVTEKIVLSEPITTKELAEKLDAKTTDVLKKLLELGIVANINQILDVEVAVQLIKKFGKIAEVSSLELEQKQEESESEAEMLLRAPVVTVMGHVDHGKTSLLDAIRQTNVIDQEAGSITQHIGAYEVELKKGRITFLDTPGHEAFTAMRARGAQVTDTVILVVAADDGVMPQTREAIAHAEAAGVPIVVAINKIDKPNANPDKVKKQLMELNRVPEEWGGETIFVEVSAKKRMGIEELLEMILLQAEILELKANPNRPAKGTILEAKLDKGRGPVATVLVQKGTLRVGDAFVTGLHYGKVRAMFNYRGSKINEAGPACPAEVLGISGVPQPGDSFIVLSDERKARQISLARIQKQLQEGRTKTAKVSLDDLFSRIKEGSVKELNIVLKADVLGSVQALVDTLEKLGTNEVRVRVIQHAVGGISEMDVTLASASNAIIIGFNVRPTPKAQELAEREGVDMRLYRVIYDIIDDIKAAMEGLLEPKYKEVILGRAEVREVFHILKLGNVAGCLVSEGVITRNSDSRIIRDSVVVYEGKVASLRRFKEDTREVSAGYECGIGLDKYGDLKKGDIIETYKLEQIARKL